MLGFFLCAKWGCIRVFARVLGCWFGGVFGKGARCHSAAQLQRHVVVERARVRLLIDDA
jgi:hypothetical protein